MPSCLIRVVSTEEQGIIYYNIFYIDKYFPFEGFKKMLTNII